MDDFGTGYSSLSYLRKLPFYGVKIDRSFIRQIHSVDSDQKFSEVIIAMAHRLGLKVVAEGIEQREQAIIIKKLNCDYAQGFLYGKPQPDSQLVKMLPQAAENYVH